MTTTFKEHMDHSRTLSTKLLDQHLSVVKCDHLVSSSVNHLNTLSSYLVTNLLQLFRTFVVPPSSNSLQSKSLPCESLSVSPFLDFLRSKSVTVRGEVPIGIRRRKPFVTKQAGFDLRKLNICILRYARGISEAAERSYYNSQEIDTLSKILYEALFDHEQDFTHQT